MTRKPTALAAREFARRVASEPGQDEIWPWWVCLPSLAAAFAILAGALMQRWHMEQPMALPLLFAAIAILPWVFDVLAVLRSWQSVIPFWVFPVPALIGSFLLIARPAEMDFAPMLLVLLAGEIASRDEGRWRTTALATLLASVGGMVAYEGAGLFTGAFIWGIGISFGWCAGFVGGILVRKNFQLEQAQTELASKAVAQERQRIAREVHDVIAHSLSVTMLHLTAARMATEQGQSEGAIEALREAERHGRSSLADIRRTVGLLGADDTSTAPPAPTAADLPTLVEDFQAAGLDVALRAEGDLTELPPGPGLDLYRIVQESLTNVAKHAPGTRAIVEIEVSDEQISLRVHNSPANGSAPSRSDGKGVGLRGMAERAATLGGTLRTDDRDGWTVSLVAPRPVA